MKTIDNTKGQRPNKNQEFYLIVEHHSGSRYSYYGETKKEAVKKFKDKFGSFTGFISKEWNLEDR